MYPDSSAAGVYDMELLDMLSVAYTFVGCLLLDCAIFVAVDYVSKSSLAHKRSAAEKRRVWLCESLCLLVVSFILYALHHTPYTLLLFACPTFAYALLYGRTSFLQAYDIVRARWNEFKEHHESLEELREVEKSRGYANQVSTAQQADFMRAAAAPTIIINPQNTTPGLNPAGQLRSLRFNEQKAVYEFVGASGHKSGDPSGSISQSSQDPAKAVVKVSDVSASHAVPKEKHLKSLEIFGNHELRRRPIRDVQPAEGEAALKAVSMPNGHSFYAKPQQLAQHLSARVWSALGLGCYAQHSGDSNGAGLPAGLRNPSGLCFVNATLQCLARSPNLAEELAEESKGVVATANPSELALLDVSAELMQEINVMPTENSNRVLDPLELRAAGSQINTDLFSSIGEPQLQQDAAEFLTWLLTELHDIINEGNKGLKKSFQKGYLHQLKIIYGDLSAKRCEQLTAACRLEIAEANGLDDSYAESIQRLSDIEWLTYKQKNCSVVDDLFTGQMVAIYMCMRCNKVSVSTQTFNVLHVPLPDWQKKAAVTTLDDCLQAYGIIETLRSSESVHCEACHERAASRRSTAHLPNQKSTQQLLLPGALMSPIPGGGNTDASTYGSDFITSTPTAHSPDWTAVDRVGMSAEENGSGQRRCLLRQLSDCLVLQLMRFQYNTTARQSRKIKTAVVVPIEHLDLSNVVYDAVTRRQDLTSSREGSSASYHYSLYGVCLHLGAESTAFGHYVSYARAVDGKWYRFDDEIVSRVADMEAELQLSVVQENCYLLFYHRQLSASE